MGKTIRAQSPPFPGRLKLPPTLRTRPRFTTWTIRNRRPTRERWSVVVNGYGVVSHSSGLPIKKATHSQHPLNPYTPYPNQTLPEPNPLPQTLYPNQTLYPKPNPLPQTLYPKHTTPNPLPQTLYPKTPNPLPQTPNPKPQTPNPKPQTPTPNSNTHTNTKLKHTHQASKPQSQPK